MAFTWNPLSLFSDGPTAEHIEYALPTMDSLPTTTYHHIQHFLPNGTPGASSTHIEYADDPSFSSSRSVSSEATLPSFSPRHPPITTTPPRREQGTERPSTPPSISTSTSTSSSPSPSPSVHVRFAGDLPLPLRSSSFSSSSSSSFLPPSSSPSTATSQAADSRNMRTSPSRTRPHLSRNRPSSPYPSVRGGDPPADVVAQEEGGRAVGSLRSEGEGEEVALSTYAGATTVARTAFVDREEVWDESGFLFEEGEE